LPVLDTQLRTSGVHSRNYRGHGHERRGHIDGDPSTCSLTNQLEGKPTSEKETPRSSGARRCSAQLVLCVVATEVAVVDVRRAKANNAAPRPSKCRLTCYKTYLGNRCVPRFSQHSSRKPISTIKQGHDAIWNVH
jgi:hypothetical protein